MIIEILTFLVCYILIAIAFLAGFGYHSVLKNKPYRPDLTFRDGFEDSLTSDDLYYAALWPIYIWVWIVQYGILLFFIASLWVAETVYNFYYRRKG